LTTIERAAATIDRIARRIEDALEATAGSPSDSVVTEPRVAA